MADFGSLLDTFLAKRDDPEEHVSGSLGNMASTYQGDQHGRPMPPATSSGPSPGGDINSIISSFLSKQPTQSPAPSLTRAVPGGGAKASPGSETVDVGESSPLSMTDTGLASAANQRPTSYPQPQPSKSSFDMSSLMNAQSKANSDRDDAHLGALMHNSAMMMSQLATPAGLVNRPNVDSGDSIYARGEANADKAVENDLQLRQEHDKQLLQQRQQTADAREAETYDAQKKAAADANDRFSPQSKRAQAILDATMPGVFRPEMLSTLSFNDIKSAKDPLEIYAKMKDKSAELSSEEGRAARHEAGENYRANVRANIDRSSARDAKREQQEESGVQHLGNDLSDLTSSNGDLKTLLGVANGKGDIPGVGAWDSRKPAFMQSEEETGVQEAIKRALSKKIKATSGTVASESEVARLSSAYGLGPGATEQQFRAGVRQLATEIQQLAKQKEAKYRPEVVQAFKARGGLGSESMPSGEDPQGAQPQAITSIQSRIADLKAQGMEPAAIKAQLKKDGHF